MDSEIILYNDVNQDNRLTAEPSFSGRLWWDFTAYLQVAETSSDTCLKCVRQFFIYLKSSGLSAPTEETILSYKAYLKRNRLVPATMHYIVALKSFLHGGKETILSGYSERYQGRRGHGSTGIF